MKTEVKKLDSTTRELTIEVTGDTIKNKFEDVFKKISNEAKVPGFRPGHIPQDILEKNFSGHAHETVLRELIPELYNKAIEKEALDVIDMPNISDVKLDRNALSFKASVEVTPEINLKNYKGIKINYKKPEVTMDDVKRFVDSLKEARKIDQVDDSFAKSLGYPNLSELEKSLEMQLLNQKQTQERQKIESHVIETILKDLDFKVPQVMVNRQVEDMLRQTKLDMALKGMPRDKIDEQDKTLREGLQKDAQTQVKTYLVLAEIARHENIPVDEFMPRKVIELLLKEADWS